MIDENSTLKQKLIIAGKEQGIPALEKSLNNPVSTFAIAAIKGWISIEEQSLF